MTFGSFTSICHQSALPLCFLLGPPSSYTTASSPLLPTSCSARSIELANTIIFQAASDFAHIAALFMTAIMIFHVRSKFTAVGRKEILTFFYVYLLLTMVSLVVDAGVLQADPSSAFPWFVAVQDGLVSALCSSLLINGFVGFQLYEDGTRLSVWLLRLGSLIMFVISFAVSLLTFKGWAGLSPQNTTGLFVVLYIINAICLAVYFIMQVLLVANTLQDRWPLGDLAFGAFFFVIGQVILYTFGEKICEGVSHYLDGLFFATVCNLLAVMMVYKYWDSITKEDLEFSVGTKQGHWDVKDSLLDPSSTTADPLSMDYRASFYGGSIRGARESVYSMSLQDGGNYTAGTPTSAMPQLPAHFSQHPALPSPGSGYGHQLGYPQSQSQSRDQSHGRGQSRDRMSGYGARRETREQLMQYYDEHETKGQGHGRSQSQGHSRSQSQGRGLRSRDGISSRDREREREREYAY